MSLLESIYQKSPIFIQTLMLNVKALELYHERYGKKFDRLLEEFLYNERSSEDEIKAYQTQRLTKLVAHAYTNVPYYREVFDAIKLKPNDIQSLSDLHKIPVLTKEDIKNNYSRMIDRSKKPSELRYGHTSGTTGTPLNVAYDIPVCVAHHVADRRQKMWAGMKMGDKYASLQGRVICPTSQDEPPFWRYNYVNKQLFLSSFHLQKQNIQYYLDKLAKDDIRFIEGYPSTIYTLASYLKSTNQTFPLKAVLTSSETLFDFQRELIEEVFECRMFDFYGMAERTVFATECDAHEGHHLNEDYGITEFLDDNNEAVEVGATGKIVATSLHNFGFPMIRYQTNDSCSQKIEACSCGRAFPLMDDVATKNEAIVTLPDGRWISPSVLTHPFKPMHNIAESKIIQEDLHNIVVKIVKRADYSDADEKMLLSGFEERIGTDVKVHVEYVDKIEKTKNGKLKWVESKVKAKF